MDISTYLHKPQNSAYSLYVITCVQDLVTKYCDVDTCVPTVCIILLLVVSFWEYTMCIDIGIWGSTIQHSTLNPNTNICHTQTNFRRTCTLEVIQYLQATNVILFYTLRVVPYNTRLWTRTQIFVRHGRTSTFLFSLQFSQIIKPVCEKFTPLKVSFLQQVSYPGLWSFPVLSEYRYSTGKDHESVASIVNTANRLVILKFPNTQWIRDKVCSTRAKQLD